jgi:hypothetical protein
MAGIMAEIRAQLKADGWYVYEFNRSCWQVCRRGQHVAKDFGPMRFPSRAKAWARIRDYCQGITVEQRALLDAEKVDNRKRHAICRRRSSNDAMRSRALARVQVALDLAGR